MDDPATPEPWVIGREAMTAPTRLILGAAALAPLAGAWDLLGRPGPRGLAWPGLPPLLMGLVAAGLGLLLLAAAGLAPAREVTVDPGRRLILDRGWTRVGLARTRAIGFAAVESVLVDEDPDADSEPRLRLAAQLRGRRRPLVLARAPTRGRAEAEALAGRLRAALQA